MKPSVSFGARHDSYADDPEHRCRPRTRQYVLKRLQGWIDNVTSKERIFWLHGVAGSGKSAIAHTIADSNLQHKVAATFFFCRSDIERNDGNRLFITLAWQLAISNPDFKSHIVQSLNRDPGLPWRSVETQFKELILQPFRAMMHHTAPQAQLPSWVVIIDGIDECADENLQRRILSVLGNAANEDYVPLRFLVSSRLQVHIKTTFDQFKCPILCIDLRYEKLEELVAFEAIYNLHGENRAHQWKFLSHNPTLKQTQNWVDNPNDVDRIIWLGGPAGSGKSAIARAIADSNERKKVVATFFLDGSNATRIDGTRIFPTLCWQFASSFPVYRDYIIQYLDKCSYFPSGDIIHQFQELIVKPFDALENVAPQSASLNPVVIIHGFDKSIGMITELRFLLKTVTEGRIPLRLFVSSEFQLRIEKEMNRFGCRILIPDFCVSAEPHYKLEIAHQKEYSDKAPYFGWLSEPAIILTFPPAYDHDSFPTELATRRAPPHPANTDPDDAVEEYFKTMFSYIATRQGLGEAWPSQQMIQDFVNKSCGQLIYAHTLISLIQVEGNDAKTVLNLIRDLQPRTQTSFAYLDELYRQILKWEPDQVFLKDILALIVIRTPMKNYEYYWPDDAMLLNVSEKELETKFQRLRPLLFLGTYIEARHPPFLDFLQDPSRSDQYYISIEEASRRYLKLITRSLVQCFDKALDQPEYHRTRHLKPGFNPILKEYPPRIELSVAEWQEMLQPLLDRGPEIFIYCTGRTAIRILRDLILHLAFLCGVSSVRSTNTTVVEFEEYLGATTAIDDSKHVYLQVSTSHPGPTSTEVMSQMYALPYPDCADIAARLNSFSDAQVLVDLITDMLDKKLFLNHSPDIERKAVHLIFEIYARIPVLPRSLFSAASTRSGIEKWNCPSSEIEILCQSALIGHILDNEHIVPVSWICEEEGKFTFVSVNEHEKSEPLSQWRLRTSPNSQMILHVMLRVAKAFRYIHLMGIVLHYNSTNLDDIFLDSNLSAKIRFLGSFVLYIVKMPSVCLPKRSKMLMTRETNVFQFGCLFYEMAFNVKIPHEDRLNLKRDIVVRRPITPKIPNHVWELIQLCCREDPKRRPTMDEIVMEMERWC